MTAAFPPTRGSEPADILREQIDCAVGV